MLKISRKLWKAIALVFPIIYFFQPKSVTLTILGIALAVFIILEIIRFSIPKLNKKACEKLKFIMKEKEKNKISTTTLFLISAFLTILFFQKQLAILAIFFFVFGDSLAEIIGIKYGKIKLTKDKNLEGTLACLISCLIIGIIFVYFFKFNLIMVSAGALTTTILSIIPIKIDDNLTMPFISSLIMSFF